MNDDFYIGYRKVAPLALARFVRVVSGVLILTVVAIAGIIGALQQPADLGSYDFGETSLFLVTLVRDPMLLGLDDDPEQTNGRAVLIVGRGKHGPPAFVDDGMNTDIGFTGSVVERDGVRMLEVGVEVEFALREEGRYEIKRHSVGDVMLEGELIDTKCFLGVMKPGHGKVHRGCAALCLRGGVPPGLAIRDHHGSTKVIVLNARSADAPAIDPEWAGRILRVSGSLEYFSGLPILRVSDIVLK